MKAIFTTLGLLGVGASLVLGGPPEKGRSTVTLELCTLPSLKAPVPEIVQTAATEVLPLTPRAAADGLDVIPVTPTPAQSQVRHASGEIDRLPPLKPKSDMDRLPQSIRREGVPAQTTAQPKPENKTDKPAAPISETVIAVSETPSAACGGAVTAGVGLYLLQPRFGANPGFVNLRTTVNPAGTTLLTASGSKDFDWNAEAAPRFWIGYTLNESWMLRTRFWTFDHSADGLVVGQGPDPVVAATTIASVGALPFVSLSLPPGALANTIRVDSALHMDVLDLEVAYTSISGLWSFEGAAGLRYAEIAQHYDASLFNPGNAIVPRTFIDQREENGFYGWGPTLAGEVGYDIGYGVALYGNVRGSLLFGRNYQNANQTAAGGIPANQGFVARGSQDVILPVGELEMGVSWSRDLNRRLRVMAKTGFVGQVWFDAGSATIPPGGSFPSIQSFALGTSSPVPIVAPTSSNLGLLGLTATVGFQF